ncbi:MAG: hypothetical protein KDA96_08875 [Planctomycetaceae bacterium]|nr:hypothetical protein [Planctomycetaceae bacterium]
MRAVTKHYQDPLDVIWIHAANRLGMQIRRSSEVFASWDGRGTLTIGTPETLDADDSLAQMIFHEICHALCEAPVGLSEPDWGLQSDNPAHRVREYACLRLQAALADEFGLRSLMASTTIYRRYFDRIPEQALEDEDDPAVLIAREALVRLQEGDWCQPLREALQQTSDIHRVIHRISPPQSVWSCD